ncbi:MAG: hypothetical protein K2V38_05450 [Gemmataceae bacterium]|nr:hypothetical protein [Gemmataceae bacterium]
MPTFKVWEPEAADEGHALRVEAADARDAAEVACGRINQSAVAYPPERRLRVRDARGELTDWDVECRAEPTYTARRVKRRAR